jgi:hypothetical protein
MRLQQNEQITSNRSLSTGLISNSDSSAIIPMEGCFIHTHSVSTYDQLPLKLYENVELDHASSMNAFNKNNVLCFVFLAMWGYFD